MSTRSVCLNFLYVLLCKKILLQRRCAFLVEILRPPALLCLRVLASSGLVHRVWKAFLFAGLLNIKERLNQGENI